jgi:TetR/AcrR family transcriptional regulator, cholesterol catabolism regulator
VAEAHSAARTKPETPAMADRRTRILGAATRRFAEAGFGATTVRQIADDVGILSGSLYHHFATKEEILDAIVRDAVLRLRDVTLRIADAPADAEQRLVALVLTDLCEFTDHQAIHAILFHERKFFRRSPDFAYVPLARKQAYDAWRKVLEDGIDEGLFRPGIDIFLTISTFVRMLNTGADWYTHEDGSAIDAPATYTLRELSDFYLDMVLRSVRTVERAAQPIPREAAESLTAAA